VVCGAEPLFLLDYVAVGRVVPERMVEIVGGIAEGCRMAGCALIGGETAEHPGVMEADAYDLAATAIGVVEAEEVLGPKCVREGDVVIALAASGLHSNGFSLVRHALLSGPGRMPLDAHVDELGGRALGEVLLTPTRIYARDCLALVAEVEMHAFSHVTGGGIAANLARVLPGHLDAVVERGSWVPGPEFGLLAFRGRVAQEEMERTFNLGIGMLAVVPPEEVDRALAVCMGRRLDAWVAGEIVAGTGTARLTGDHPTG
jgi:phosphoribosylformylglycinamidine cyclo-ligase